MKPIFLFFFVAISFGFIAISVVIGAQKFYPLHLNWSRLIIVLVGTTAMGFIMSPAWLSEPILSLLLKFPVGVLVVIIIIKIIAHDVLRWLISQTTMLTRRG